MCGCVSLWVGNPSPSRPLHHRRYPCLDPCRSASSSRSLSRSSSIPRPRDSGQRSNGGRPKAAGCPPGGRDFGEPLLKRIHRKRSQRTQNREREYVGGWGNPSRLPGAVLQGKGEGSRDSRVRVRVRVRGDEHPLPHSTTPILQFPAAPTAQQSPSPPLRSGSRRRR